MPAGELWATGAGGRGRAGVGDGGGSNGLFLYLGYRRPRDGPQWAGSRRHPQRASPGNQGEPPGSTQSSTTQQVFRMRASLDVSTGTGSQGSAAVPLAIVHTFDCLSLTHIQRVVVVVLCQTSHGMDEEEDWYNGNTNLY